MATHSYLGQVLAGTSDTTSYTNYTSIGELISFSGPNISVSSVKTTHLASTSAADEFTPGFADGGTLTTRLNMVKGNVNTLYGFYRTLKYLWVVFNDSTASSSAGSRFTVAAFWTEMSNECPENDRITTDLTWKVTGKPAFTSAT